MDISILLPTIGSPWIIPPAKTGRTFHSPVVGHDFLFLPRNMASAPPCPVFLPAPFLFDRLLGFTCQSIGRGATGTSFSELTWTHDNWCAQFREEVESVEGFRERVQFWMSHFQSDLRSTYHPCLSLPCLNSQLIESLPLLWKPLNQFVTLNVLSAFDFEGSLIGDLWSARRYSVDFTRSLMIPFVFIKHEIH